MHFTYANFCTDRAFLYRSKKEITRESILRRPLTWNKDALSVGNLSSSSESYRISIPIQEELADVLVYCRNMLDKPGQDEDEIVNSKMNQNESKYPVDKARGSAA